MEEKEIRQVRLVRDEDVEVLPKSKPIEITATGTGERRNGESVVRFAFGEKDDHPRKLFRKLSPWHKFLQEFAVEVEGEATVSPCSLRECSFDPQTERLYISIYTPVSAERVLDWF